MELIAGLDPSDIRGEDWNLNNRLDPNEDDGEGSMPNDEPDGVLDAGWSGYLTASSVDGGATASGLPRIYFPLTSVPELVERLQIDEAQAAALLSMAQGDGFMLESLISTPLEGSEGGEGEATIAPLQDWQIQAIFDETATSPSHQPNVGKLNINTASRRLMMDVRGRRTWSKAF